MWSVCLFLSLSSLLPASLLKRKQYTREPLTSKSVGHVGGILPALAFGSLSASRQYPIRFPQNASLEPQDSSALNLRASQLRFPRAFCAQEPFIWPSSCLRSWVLKGRELMHMTDSSDYPRRWVIPRTYYLTLTAGFSARKPYFNVLDPSLAPTSK